MPVSRRHLIAAAASWPLLGPTCAWASTNTNPLRVGLVPYLSTRQMINVFEPLRVHLQQQLQRPVILYTAADLRALGRHIHDGHYDLAFVPAHFMRLAAQDWGWAFLARSVTPTKIVLVSRKNRQLKLPLNPLSLVGTHLVSLDAVSITSLITLDWLRANGLTPGSDVLVEFIVTASSVLHTLDRPEVTALAVVEPALADLNATQRESLEVVAELSTVPSPGYIAHPQCSTEERQTLLNALLTFKGMSQGSGTLSRAPLEATQLTDSDRIERYSGLLRTALAPAFTAS